MHAILLVLITAIELRAIELAVIKLILPQLLGFFGSPAELVHHSLIQEWENK